MSSYLDKTGLERVWSKATDKFATIATTDELKGNIETLTSTKADKTEVETAVAGLVDSAPETLNTLNELAAALGDDPNFATTIATEVGKKVNSSEYNDAIAGINANIASITPEKIGALNKEEYLGPVVLEGNPIVYESGTEGLGIAAVSYLEPKQEGSGDPYPAGGGVNLLNVAACTPSSAAKDRTVTINGEYITITTNAVTIPQAPLISFDEITLSPGVYTLVLTKALPGMVRTNGSELYVHPGKTFATFNLRSEFTFSQLAIDLTEGTAVNETFGICIRADDVAKFAPYANIRPFIGYDKLELNHAGKNLFNPETATTGYAVASDGTLYREAELAASDYIRVVPGAAYRIGWNTARWLGLYYGDKSFIAIATVQDSILIPPEGCNYIRATISVEELNTFYVSVGTALAAYKPYQGKLHTVQLDRIVYGGRMDWLTGKLTDGIPPIEFDGDEVVSTDGGGIFTTSAFGAASAAYGEMWCSHYVVARDYDSFMNTDMSVCVWASGQIRIHDSRFNTVSEINAEIAAQKAAGTPVQIAYKLATPIEIQLTPTQISELEGINTLYGDGSNIRAIFNTTGSASPVLESISGILPVEKGGTGSMSAAGARNNLGITPENIGALGNSGRQKIADGTFIVGNRNGNASNLDLYTDDTNTTLRFLKDGENNTNNLSLYEEYTILGKPLTVSSGGTGATTSEQARANLLWIGYNPITSAANDTVENWKKYGSGSLCMYNQTDQLIDQPSRYGLISTYSSGVNSTEIHQIWMTQANGDMLHRGGNAEGWSGTWRKILDSSNYTSYTVTKTGTGASGTWGISVTGSSASCTGNAATATTLQTTRSINGTNFNGSANITTANWGTARTISISSTAGTTGTSINGSANASLVIPTTLTGFSSISSTSFSASSGKYYGRAGNLPLLVPAAGDFYFQSVDSSNTSGDSNFRKGAIKFLCNKNANFDGVVVGRYHPNSHGILVGDIYDSSTIDSTTGLPQYSTFWGSNLAGSILIFGTENYNYYERGVLDSSNYTGYTVKKDGTGASGTWGISISGNAATATSLSGTLAVNKGGTGITSNPSMLVNLSSTSAASVFAASPRPGITGTLAIGNGGTGATSKSGARTNLGITSGTSLPSSASAGDIFFLYS